MSKKENVYSFGSNSNQNWTYIKKESDNLSSISSCYEGGDDQKSQNQNELTDLQKQKEALKKFILGIKEKPDQTQIKKQKKELKQISNFMIDRTLGEGTFGKVKLGIHTITKEKVAIKILEKDKIQDQMDIDRIAREIKILKKIRHQRVIQLYQIIETEQDLYLIMEHANAGELFEYIVQNDRVDDITAAKFFDQILEGIQHLHENGVCHRDLKPENLLLEKTSKNIKIIDFGLSNMYIQNQTLQTACGSPCYAAPEMIAGKEYNGLQVDIWSSGVILYAMLCGYLPFEDPDTDKLYQKILNCDYSFPKYISDLGKDLIQKILNTNPQERFNIQKIRDHPWFLKNLEKFKQSEIQNNINNYESLGIFFNSNNSSNLNNREIKINPQIIIDIVEKFKIQNNSQKQIQNNTEAAENLNKTSQHENFTIEGILKSLAFNKHNDSTTTYYLLHKKWIQEIFDESQTVSQSQQLTNQKTIENRNNSGISLKLFRLQKIKKAQEQLISLTQTNCDQIIFKLMHQLEKKSHDNQKTPDKVKNLIEIKEDKIKMNESASLVIKSPAGPAFNRFRIKSGQQSNNNREYKKAPTKELKLDIVAQTTSMPNKMSDQSSKERRGKDQRKQVRSNQNQNSYDTKLIASQKKQGQATYYQVESSTPIYSSKGGKPSGNQDVREGSSGALSQRTRSDLTHISESQNKQIKVKDDVTSTPYDSKRQTTVNTTKIQSKKNSLGYSYQTPNNIYLNTTVAASHNRHKSTLRSEMPVQKDSNLKSNLNRQNFNKKRDSSPINIQNQSKQQSLPSQKYKLYQSNNKNLVILEGKKNTSINLLAEFNDQMNTNGQKQRYKSQQRGATEVYKFKGIGSQNKFNNAFGEKNNNNMSSRAQSRVSRLSGTNVSYQSNFSAIKLNIQRFKNKNTNLEGNQQVKRNLINLEIPRKGSQTPGKYYQAQNTLRQNQQSVVKNENQEYSNDKYKNYHTEISSREKGLLEHSTPINKINLQRAIISNLKIKSPINKQNMGLMTARSKNNKTISGFQVQNAAIQTKRGQNSSPKHLSVQRTAKDESKKQQNIRQMIGYGQMGQKTFIKNKHEKKPLKTVNINLDIEKKGDNKPIESSNIQIEDSQMTIKSSDQMEAPPQEYLKVTNFEPLLSQNLISQSVNFKEQNTVDIFDEYSSNTIVKSLHQPGKYVSSFIGSTKQEKNSQMNKSKSPIQQKKDDVNSYFKQKIIVDNKTANASKGKSFGSKLSQASKYK